MSDAVHVHILYHEQSAMYEVDKQHKFPLDGVESKLISIIDP